MLRLEKGDSAPFFRYPLEDFRHPLKMSLPPPGRNPENAPGMYVKIQIFTYINVYPVFRHFAEYFEIIRKNSDLFLTKNAFSSKDIFIYHSGELGKCQEFQFIT